MKQRVTVELISDHSYRRGSVSGPGCKTAIGSKMPRQLWIAVAGSGEVRWAPPAGYRALDCRVPRYFVQAKRAWWAHLEVDQSPGGKRLTLKGSASQYF